MSQDPGQDPGIDALAIIESAPEPLLVLDRDLRVVWANVAFYRAFQRQPAETEQHQIHLLSGGPWDSLELHGALNRLLATGTSFEDLAFGFSSAGSRSHAIRISGRRVKTPAGDHAEGRNHRRALRGDGSDDIGDIVLSLSTTAQHLMAVEATYHSEVKYRRLFEAARDGILLLDGETGKITDANPFMSELLEYPHDALLNKQLWEIGLFSDQAASQAAFLQLQDTGYIRYEYLPLETANGEKRDVEFVSNVYREEGKVVIQCNIRDITGRRALEEKRHEAFLRERRIADALQHPLTLPLAENAFPGLLVASLYKPALDEALIGGDFFDAFSLPADAGTPGTQRVALAIADASGKGLSAAAHTLQVKDVLRAFARESPSDPAEVVSRLNRFVWDTRHLEGKQKVTFTCLILAVLDLVTGRGSIVTAGCEPPLLLRIGGAAEAIAVIDGAGLPLGVLREEVYRALPFHLAPGDTLILVTDGITEARQNNDFLEYEGMVGLATQGRAAPTLVAMGQTIMDGAHAFGGGALQDDACILLARRL